MSCHFMKLKKKKLLDVLRWEGCGAGAGVGALR
jgi:hypothetical protein